LSSTTKYKDLLEILDKFSVLKYNNIIATKIDETNSFGQVLSALLERKLTLSYISFGQSVPEHLKSATKVNLLETLFNY
ncbi:MAG: flagellar biosynthesis protein FlhF, partial [Spirochaetota bacterium]